MLATVLIVVIVLSLGAEYLAKKIPFASELEWAGDFYPDEHEDAGHAATRVYLNQLAGRLLQAHPLPEGMEIRVHYQDADVVNAYASLGGNIVIFQGLLDVLPSENALAMVLAHEIAHVRERHPIASMGRGASVSLVLALLGGLAGNGGVEVFSQAGVLTMLNFSRSQEAEADRLALAMVQGLYGHVADSDAFFRAMLAQEGAPWVPQFLQTHPMNAMRVEDLHSLANSRGWRFEGEVVRLP